MSEHRLFTVDEANKLLPMLAPLLECLKDENAAMEERHDAVLASIPTNGGGVVHREYLEASREAARIATEIEEMGVIVRDPSTGLIDFRAMREGEDVFLCWRLGEEAVEWWHTVETGFSGRRRL